MKKGDSVMIPRFALIEQTLPNKFLNDIPHEICAELTKHKLSDKVKPGMRIAITAGSRGIKNIPLILRTLANQVRECGGEPFLVPTMGSHGGATAEGQLEVLEGLGITQETVGAPIMATMDVVQLGETSRGIPVYLDAYAAKADGIIIVARVKPHTDFRANIESGLHKMITIGLGKHKQALEIHRHGMKGVVVHMPEVAQMVLEKAPVLLGLAILENGYDQTAKIVVLEPSEFATEEPKLLEEARALMPILPFDEADVLLVGEIGKNFSGTGLDTNVIGRMRIYGEPEFDRPRIQYIVAHDLSVATHGNATGIGLADFTTQKLMDKSDYKLLLENVLTGTNIYRGNIPLVLSNDRSAIEAAQRCLWMEKPVQARMAYILNTLEVSRLLVSESLLPVVSKQMGVKVLSELNELEFDGEGNIILPTGLHANYLY